MNLKQIQQDFANNIIVNRATLVRAIDYAVELEACLKERLAIWDDDSLYGTDYDMAASLNEDRMRELLKDK